MSEHKYFTATNIALIAVFAGFIAASTIWGGVPLGAGVPVTLQTLTVLLAGAVLGAWRGAAAVILYLIVGTAGAPIFAEHIGGPAVWASPTAGFLISFVVAAYVVGLLAQRLRNRGQLTLTGLVGACAVGSLLVINVIGWTFLGLKLGLTFSATVAIAAPFLVGDIVKVFLAAVIASAIHRAYPGILPRRTSASTTTDAPASASTVGEADGKDSKAFATA